jgi:hypothetical protein
MYPFEGNDTLLQNVASENVVPAVKVEPNVVVSNGRIATDSSHNANNNHRYVVF